LAHTTPQVENAYMAEGTAAHALCEEVLLTGKFDAGGDEDLERCVNIYHDEVQQVRLRGPMLERVEQTIEHTTLADLGGTMDYFALYNEGDHVVCHIIDYKHGAGTLVYAEENPQLLTYAVILSSHFGLVATKYRFTIVQPRAFNHDEVQHWDTTPERLVEHLVAIVAATKSTALNPGEHCRYCVAAPTCPALQSVLLETAKLDFQKAETADLLRIHDLAGTITSTLERIKLLLVQQAKDGVELPGHKIVESKSHRRWAMSDEEILKALAKLKVGKKQATKTTLLSPAQIEKVISDKKAITPLVKQFVVGYKVLPNDAKGTPCDLSAINVESVFPDDLVESGE
jgi:hypothetical protein